MKFKWKKYETWTAEVWGKRATVTTDGHVYTATIDREPDMKNLFTAHTFTAEEGMAACEAEAKKWLDKATDIFEGKK
jgi:hypothetical protein